jgi:prepilin-type N-terminal cleavage/methylation domain-containing protein
MKHNGFTLVEMLISLTVLFIALGAIFYALSAELRLWDRTAASVEKQQVLHLLLSRINLDARSASEILPASGPRALSLRVGGDTIDYTLSEGKVKRTKNRSAAYLTTEEEIKEFSFSYPTANLIVIKIDGLTTKVFLRN